MFYELRDLLGREGPFSTLLPSRIGRIVEHGFLEIRPSSIATLNARFKTLLIVRLTVAEVPDRPLRVVRDI